MKLYAPLLHQDHEASAVCRGARPSGPTVSWAEEAGGEDLLPGLCEETLNSPAAGGCSPSRRGKHVCLYILCCEHWLLLYIYKNCYQGLI